MISLASCSEYNQIVRSNDIDLIYRSALDYYNRKKDDKALNLFYLIAPYYRGTVRDDTISFYSAVCSYRIGDYVSSGEMFEDFKITFPRSPFMEEAEYLLGIGYYYASPAPERDQTPTRLAITALNQYVTRYPNSPRRDQCNEYIVELTQKLWDKELLNAKVYYNLEYYQSAIHALKTSLRDYPQTNHREEILYLIMRSHYLLAEHSVPNLKQSRYLDTKDAYLTLILEFPETEYLREAEKISASVDLELEKYDSGGTRDESLEIVIEEGTVEAE